MSISIFFLLFLSSCSDSQSHNSQSNTSDNAASISNTTAIDETPADTIATDTATIAAAATDTITADPATTDIAATVAAPKPDMDYSSYSGNWVCNEKATSLEIRVDSLGNVTGSITTVVGSHVPSSSIEGKIESGILTSKLLVDDSDPGILELSFTDPDALTGNVKMDKEISYWTLAEGDMHFIRYSTGEDNTRDITTNSDATGLAENESLEMYKAVLQNKKQFFSTGDFFSGDKKALYLDDLLKNAEDTENPALKILHFTVLDMDGDKAPEVVLELSMGGEYPDFYEVLHIMNGSVYGYNIAARGLEELKTDGTLLYSNGASDWGISKLTFMADTYEYHDIAYCRSSEDGTTELYFINNEAVKSEAFNSFTKKQGEKAGVVWHEFTDKNIEAELTD